MILIGIFKAACTLSEITKQEHKRLFFFFWAVFSTHLIIPCTSIIAGPLSGIVSVISIAVHTYLGLLPGARSLEMQLKWLCDVEGC
ncbi:hypothetical protein EUGRSUZ_E02512 [Eucalyptus grandis]|uniref:Uncharacterized protein n=2 Tax=Eucalyptus grandis TaxID=71139 RepID=A0A059C7N9_EUCGR|nr:hypothetical protein EUGRSUZ_E02512 [Eucalyptus grandis]